MQFLGVPKLECLHQLLAALFLCFPVIFCSHVDIDSKYNVYQRSKSPVFSIRPKSCTNEDNVNGVCMFNFECYRKSGLVIGTCIDRFMFGACCQLEPSESAVAQLVSAGVEDSQPSPLTDAQDKHKPPKNSPKPTNKPTTTISKPNKTAKPVSDNNNKPPKKQNNIQKTKNTTKKPSKTQEDTTKKTSVNDSKVTTAKPKTTTQSPVTKTTEKPSTTTSTPTKSTTTRSTTTTRKWDYKKHCGVIPLQSHSEVISRSAVRRARIVGGETAYFAAWPWQVLVKEATFLGLFTKNKCGGVLVNSRYVLTAAHCQPGFLATLIAVFGDFDLSASYEPKTSFQRNVRRIIVHRGFNAVTFENDLALLELDRAVTFDEHVVPICLPDRAEKFEGEMATVTGWGRTSFGGDVPSKLMQVKVPVIENTKCQEWFDFSGHSKRIVDGFQCAGYKNGVMDSCEGDSGGPLVTQRSDGRWVLVGTVSHGIKCAWPNLPGIYMRMPFYRDWLEKHMSSS